MSDVAIRPYNPEIDYPNVEANLRQAELFDADRDTEERLRQYAHSVLVAEKDGQVVGSVYVVDHIVPTLFRLVVNENHRRQGIGSALVEASKQRLETSGAKDLELFFEAHDRDLAAWYHRRGFKEGGSYRSMWDYITPPES
ncbi:MAG TPA: GNAT family N-acetyltransferase [Candidatus Saccharimonadales bacterium]|nr:GNAT family N-acetyltransferase [Candidatus Saccharimonadales bacterium]